MVFCCMALQPMPSVQPLTDNFGQDRGTEVRSFIEMVHRQLEGCPKDSIFFFATITPWSVTACLAWGLPFGAC